jgi:hypothetical protein
MPAYKELANHAKSFPPNDVCAYVIWTVGDVISRAKEIGLKVTKRQAEDILEDVHYAQDASSGISWTTFDDYIIDRGKQV